MGPWFSPPPWARLRIVLLAIAGAGLLGHQASSGTLVLLKKTVWGCVDPNVAATINDDANPARRDAQWVARTSELGQCVLIPSNSPGEPLSEDHYGLTYMTYRGNPGKPGSFWVPTTALAFTQTPAQVQRPTPPIIAEPLPPPRSTSPIRNTGAIALPSTLPLQQAAPLPPVTPDTSSPVELPSAPAPGSPPPAPPSEGGGWVVGVLAVLFALAIFGFYQRSRSRQERGRADPRQGLMEPVAGAEAVFSILPSSLVQQEVSSETSAGENQADRSPMDSRMAATGVPFRIHASSFVQIRNRSESEAAGQAAARALPSRQIPSKTTAPKVTVRIDDKSRSPEVSSSTPGSQKQAKVIWHPPGAKFDVAGQTIQDGMVYVGLSSGQYGAHDGCCIDPSLPVASSGALAGALGYWPSYRGITPDCRRKYIEWLAAGKRTENVDIGYVFLYFYGLERRLFLDEPPPAEVSALAVEVERLRGIYAGNHSFEGYSRRLLEAVTVIVSGDSERAVPFAPDLTSRSGDMPTPLKVAIAREVVAGRPLGFELAAAALLSLDDFYSKNHVLLDKGRSEFLGVFRCRFQTAFPTGFNLRNRKDSQLQLRYRGASAGLDIDLAARAGLKGLPDPTTLTWTKLLNLAEGVTHEIAPHVRVMVHHPHKANCLSALLTCPPELRESTAAEAMRWLEDLPSPAAVRFSELARRAIGSAGRKWTTRHHRQVCEALAAAGRSMEPDPEDGSEHLEDDTVVYVFPWPSSGRSHALRRATAGAILVAEVARGSDGRAEAVADFWLAKLSSRLSLTADEATRLRTSLAWFGSKGFGLGKVRRVLADATTEDKEFCAWSATVAAGALGTIGKPQIAMLEAVYDGLGVPRGSLYAGLHAGLGAAAAPADEPVIVSEEIVECLHPITRPTKVGQPGADLDRLARIRAETELVSAMLAEIFTEGDSTQQVQETAADGIFAGLDSEHATLVAKLLAKSEWPRDEFDAAAAAELLMPNGAMEAINEWSLDRYGDALIEDGDPVLVNVGLLPSERVAVAPGE